REIPAHPGPAGRRRPAGHRRLISSPIPGTPSRQQALLPAGNRCVRTLSMFPLVNFRFPGQFRADRFARMRDKTVGLLLITYQSAEDLPTFLDSLEAAVDPLEVDVVCVD